ncbi:MAG: hypothetical protein Kow00107_08620 [Planctomycetota bacterium]
MELTDSEGELVGGPAKGCPFWTRGTFRLRLPTGFYKLSVTRGPFYSPYRETPYIEIKDNEITEIEMPLTPWVALRSQNWYGFDPFVVTAAGTSVGAIPSIPLAALIAEAEGCDAVFCAAPWWHDPPPNIEPVSDPLKLADLAVASSTDVLRVSTSVLYDSRPYYGWFYRMGGGPPIQESLPDDPYVPNALKMKSAREGGSAVIVRNPTRGRTARFSSARWNSLSISAALFGELYQVREGFASELPYDLEAGLVDAIEIQDDNDICLWFNALNCGYRISAVRSSGARLGSSIDSLPSPVNYAFIKGNPTVGDYIEAVRKGRIVFGDGPFVEFTVDSYGPGSVVSCDGQDHFFHIKCLSRVKVGGSILKAELIRNGTVVRSYEGQDSPLGEGEAAILPRELRIAEKEDCWYVVRAFDSSGGVTYTNPIYFRSNSFREDGWLPRTIVLSFSEDLSKQPEIRAEVGDRALPVELRMLSASRLEVSLSGGFPPETTLLIRVEGKTEFKVNVFAETVFRAVLKKLSLAVDRNPKCDDPAFFDEFRLFGSSCEIPVTLEAAENP